MAFEDILLHIDSYPEPTAPAAVEQAIQLAAALGGKLSALAVRVKFPLESNRLADLLVGLGDIIEEEETRSQNLCLGSLDHFTVAARAAGVFQNVMLDLADVYSFSDQVALRARTHDFCIVPLARNHEGQQEVAQTAIFNSGRPVLIFHADHVHFAPTGLGAVVVAWDGSRCAARALSDALPLLVRAKAVRILAVLNEKPAHMMAPAAEAARHLAAHGVTAAVDEVDAGGRPIGAVLDDYLATQTPDLMVMGAFGHSRVREFVLGGATRHMLSRPRVPVFMSH